MIGLSKLSNPTIILQEEGNIRLNIAFFDFINEPRGRFYVSQGLNSWASTYLQADGTWCKDCTDGWYITLKEVMTVIERAKELGNWKPVYRPAPRSLSESTS